MKPLKKSLLLSFLSFGVGEATFTQGVARAVAD